MIFKINSFKTRFVFFIALTMMLSSCAGGLKLPGADARKIPPNAADRVAKNLEEGKGFRLNDTIKKGGGGGNFEFATSNELWRASLDIIDFMPLASANYSGGILITDWYSVENSNESIKIQIKFLNNELKPSSLKILSFKKICETTNNCKIVKMNNEFNNKILAKVIDKARDLSIKDEEKK